MNNNNYKNIFLDCKIIINLCINSSNKIIIIKMNILTKHTLDKGNTPKDILLIRRLIENEGIDKIILSQELKNMKKTL
jgi:hypothetical protein